MSETKKMNFLQKLNAIRCDLSVPKKKFNSFGNFYYRSAEDIFDGLKPLLKNYNLFLQLENELVMSEKILVKIKANLIDIDSNESIFTLGFAEVTEKKNMDPAQAIGAATSYATKYALGLLFLIDDSQDNDSYQPVAVNSSREQLLEKYYKKVEENPESVRDWDKLLKFFANSKYEQQILNFKNQYNK